MDLLQTVRKEGSRGGAADFSWSDVSTSAHRENYLGHSLKAPVGRWQRGKDLNWYARGEDGSKGGEGEEAGEELSDEQRRKEEIRKVKEAEEDEMRKALGLPPIDRSANALPLGGDGNRLMALVREEVGGDGEEKGGMEREEKREARRERKGERREHGRKRSRSQDRDRDRGHRHKHRRLRTRSRSRSRSQERERVRGDRTRDARGSRRYDDASKDDRDRRRRRSRSPRSSRR